MKLVQGRECGGCVACCKTLEIRDPQLSKPADVLCVHCTGQGCGIYNARPSVCRNWYCLWRQDGNLPDHMRPDKCGVVFSIESHDPPRTIFENLYIIGWSLDRDRSVFDAPPITAALQWLAQNGMGAVPIFCSWQLGVKGLIYPNGPLAHAIENPTTTPYGSFVFQALGWRARYSQLLRSLGHVPNFWC